MHDALSAGFTYNGTTYTGDAAKIAQGDNFLSRIVPMIQASDAYKNNGLIIIWEDETEGGNTSAYTQPFIVLSPLAKGNAYQSTFNYTHSSTLKTLQEIFRTGTLFGGSANAGVNDESDLFQPGVTPSAVGP